MSEAPLEKQNQRDVCKSEIYDKELAHLSLEAEKSYDAPAADWRPENVVVWRPKNRRASGVHFSQHLKI